MLNLYKPQYRYYNSSSLSRVIAETEGRTREEWEMSNEEKERLMRFITKKTKEEKVGAEYRIATVEEGNRPQIEYNKFQGRPGISIVMEGLNFDCLLDTGARINVISLENVQKLKKATIEKSTERLICANDSNLEVVGETRIEIKVGEIMCQTTFIVVRFVKPGLIGGILLQRQLGLSLEWRTDKEDTATRKIKLITTYVISLQNLE